MFTGIVRAVGRIRSVRDSGGNLDLEIGSGGLATSALRAGDSLCVAGVCLTTTRIDAGAVAVTASRTTLACTTLGLLAVDSPVNLEPALTAGAALGGHFVAGHVDAVAVVDVVREDAGSLRLAVAIPPGLGRYIAALGSVAIDGVSLTVIGLDRDTFEVNVIPYTRSVTTLGNLAAGATVNLEVDLLARYLERLCDPRP